jgi:KaiC/GvpD/RAD55 family RecA-like ATPase
MGHVNRPDDASSNGHGHGPKPATTTSIVMRWVAEGALVRLATGIPTLDELSRGGLPIPWRGMVVGAPSAGKTAIVITIADHLARSSVAVGILAVDEDPEDLVVRFAQMAGFTVAQAELREPVVLHEIVTALSVLPLKLYDARFTIESAAKDLATWSKAKGMRAALFLDSLQTARSESSGNAKSPREHVEGNVRAIRAVSTEHCLLVVSTSEANRAAYRGGERGEQQADLAAGAESRAIEFGAQTLLVLRTPKDHPDIVHVRVAKNRRARCGEFWLQLDRDRHTLTECANPEATAEREAGPKRQLEVNVARLEAKAKKLAEVVRKKPGMGERELRAAICAAGHGWGRETYDAVKQLLLDGVHGTRLVNRGEGKASAWFLVSLEVVKPPTEVDEY